MVLIKTILLSFVFFLSILGAANNQELQIEKMRKLAAELRCVVCQNQSLLESDSQIAKDLKELILEMYINGKSDEEIKEYLVDRYGEFILFRPKFSINNILLWFAPLVFLLIISLLALRKLSFFKREK
jgi:cytochrome c-type biogenesis protein CcmH